MSAVKWNETGRVWEEDHGLLSLLTITRFTGGSQVIIVLAAANHWDDVVEVALTRFLVLAAVGTRISQPNPVSIPRDFLPSIAPRVNTELPYI